VAEEKIPQPTFLSGLRNFYFNIKYDDSMVPITPLRLVTILLLTLQIQNEPVNEPVNDNSKPFFLQRNKIHP